MSADQKPDVCGSRAYVANTLSVITCIKPPEHVEEPSMHSDGEVSWEVYA